MKDTKQVSFVLNEENSQKFHDWISNHHKECSLKPNQYGVTGGTRKLEILFTTIGYMYTLKCTCGSSLDLTDYKRFG